ncbi:MAG: 50S ribosomal protein L11 methyltransferase, partial [Clostridia bacterium]|nr:50S ribosomal protein L11 methyltransferase [Clostridia bacterium]
MKERNPVNDMKWIEIRVESDKDITEEVSMALFEAGANGTRIQNPDEIKSLIDEAGAKELADYRDFSKMLEKYIVTAYFPAGFIFDDLKGALNERFGNVDIYHREADDSEWSGTWKKYYKAFNLTPKIKIVPSWEAPEVIDGGTIIMDPGMAFGTGTHESTSLCAALIEENIKLGQKVLDIGTGTGILSIAASKLGAKCIFALDIDPAAVKTAKHNFTRNGIDNAVVFLGELRDLEQFVKSNPLRAPFDSLRAPLDEMKFDMIAAN